MNAQQTSTATWRLQESLTLLQQPFLCGSLPLEPGEGLCSISVGGQAIDGSLWGVRAADEALGPLSSATDRYARGDDLISTHSANEAFPLRLQLCWTAQPLASVQGAMITITISLQTNLLDTRPELCLVSSLPSRSNEASDEVAAECGGRWIGDDPTWRCLEIVHPLDRSEFVAAVDGPCHRLRFAPPFLEKGVIRRSRAAAIFVGPDATDDALLRAAEDFANAKLPLTT